MMGLWCFVVLLSIAIGLVFGGDCDFTVISGNVTISSETAVIMISEKETPDTAMCSMEVPGKEKITCDLTSKYFKCKQIDFSDENTMLNISLIASVDDVADKPDSDTSWVGPLDCIKMTSSVNFGIMTNLILVKVVTVNDHVPAISSDALNINDLPETFPFGDKRFDLISIYGLRIAAADNDTTGDPTSTVQFGISDGNVDSTFSIETDTVNQNTKDEYFIAKLYLEHALDYSQKSNYSLTITATDEGVPPLQSSVILEIALKSQDIVGPVFDHDFYRAKINESLIDGVSHVISMQPEAIHAGGARDDVTYSILIDNCGISCDEISSCFNVDADSAEIIFDSSAPFQDIDNLEATFAVKATWKGGYKRSSMAMLSIDLPLSSTNTTTTSGTNVTTPASTDTTQTTSGTTVTTPASTDTTQTTSVLPTKFYESVNVAVATLVTGVILGVNFHDDVTHEYTYSAIDCDGYRQGMDYLDVSELTGSVSVRQPLIVTEFCLNVTATSGSGDDQYRTVFIDVFNGTLERVLPVDHYEVHINESKEDKVILLVDVDSYYESMQMAVYTLTTPDLSDNFLLNNLTGELFAIKGLDHESHPEYQLIISVSPTIRPEVGDRGEPEIDAAINVGNMSYSDVMVRVIVDDMNDHAPQFDVGSTYAMGITCHVGQGQIVMTLTATDADEEEAFNRIYFLMTDTKVPFYVNLNSGILKATTSLEVLQGSDVVQYEFEVTAANSEDGRVMPSQLHLTVYLLHTDEILVMTTTKSSTEFDAVISEVIDTFRDKLFVQARIIQWDTEADGSTVVYMYMLPVQNKATPSRTKRYVTSGDGPMQKKEMLSLIKENADSLEDYFKPETAKTYDDLPQPLIKSSTSGLAVAVVILATILALIVIGGAIFGYWQHRNVAKHFPEVNGSKVNGPSSEASHFSETKSMEKIGHMYEDLLSKNARKNHEVDEGRVNRSGIIPNSNHLEPIRENEEPEMEPEVTPEIDAKVITANPSPDPELDYLKSILVDKQVHDGDHKRKKSAVKFTDDVTSTSNESSTDDARL